MLRNFWRISKSSSGDRVSRKMSLDDGHKVNFPIFSRDFFILWFMQYDSNTRSFFFFFLLYHYIILLYSCKICIILRIVNFFHQKKIDFFLKQKILNRGGGFRFLFQSRWTECTCTKRGWSMCCDCSRSGIYNKTIVTRIWHFNVEGY